MKMIVGLGNPGNEYQSTRHNVGFMVVDELAKRWEISGWRSKHEALVAEYRDKEVVLLVKPQTYMNLSGVAVGLIARWYKIVPQDIIVIHDDMDINTGRLRLRAKGGSGGHRGIESILVHLGVEDFIRIRVGIGHPGTDQKVISHVLNQFSADEQKLMADTICRAADAVEGLMRQGIDKAMNKYNS